MSLLAELRAAKPRTTGCSVCLWISSRESAEQAEWLEAMADRTIAHTVIWRAMQKRGFGFTEYPVKKHRTAH